MTLFYLSHMFCLQLLLRAGKKIFHVLGKLLRHFWREKNASKSAATIQQQCDSATSQAQNHLGNFKV